jgi:hypothetical protein
MEEEKPKINPQEKNITQWARAADSIDSALSLRLDENRLVGIATLEKLDLPRAKMLTLPLTRFLEKPGEYIENMDCRHLYMCLNPRRKELPRHRQAGLAHEEIMPFIESRLSPQDYDQYDLLFIQYFRNVYGGSVMVGDDGIILVEFKEGYQGPIASGEEAPQFSAYRDHFTGSFHYSFQDPELRELIYNLVQTIPHRENGRVEEFWPGYYEFALVEKEPGQPLQPIFIDSRENPVYQFLGIFNESLHAALSPTAKSPF